MEEETKRLDVAELQDLEKRIDVLEGQPETPLVCPIYKTDLDDINDRITVLEGGTAPGPQNPMRLTELADFEGRVEELEDQPTAETVVYTKDEEVEINGTFFSKLLSLMSDLSKDYEVLLPLEGQVKPAIFILGSNTTYTPTVGSPIFEGTNYITIGFGEGGEVYISDPTSTNPTHLIGLNSVTAITSYGLVLAGTIVPNGNFTTISETFNLLNPAKAIIFNSSCDVPAFNDYETIEFTEADKDILPIKERNVS